MLSFKRIIPVFTILFALFILTGGCKKKADDPVPTFTVTADTVNLTGGGKGLQFFATSTNNGVTMSNVTITNPASGIFVHNFNSASYAQNAIFPMQATTEAYIKQLGTWKFNLVGSSSGGTAFAVNTTLSVVK